MEYLTKYLEMSLWTVCCTIQVTTGKIPISSKMYQWLTQSLENGLKAKKHFETGMFT